MRIINCGGFGNTGCTAQTDFLGDHYGVAGILLPYHETGILKCVYSFGGILLGLQQKWKHIPTKSELKRSLMGADPKGKISLSEGGRMHLELRKALAKSYKNYELIIDEALCCLPDDYSKMDFLTVLPYMRQTLNKYLSGIIANLEEKHFSGEYDPISSVLGLKNDPPGAYPVFASLLNGGMMSAVIRDPRDTTFDFNRHYGIGHTMDAVRQHCAHFNAQLNSARAQILQYEQLIQPFYKVIDFENLVVSEGFREKYRNFMVGDRERVRFNFDPEKSKVNIGHYVNMPKEYIDYIEKECMENYTTFRTLCADRNLLLE